MNSKCKKLPPHTQKKTDNFHLQIFLKIHKMLISCCSAHAIKSHEYVYSTEHELSVLAYLYLLSCLRYSNLAVVEQKRKVEQSQPNTHTDLW